jgi:glycosyltransferase involved in cell wall biosynthesis
MNTNYSVLMSVYSKEKPEHLKEAMDSIFDQSVKTDDFVLVCDGPLPPELDDIINAEKEREGNTLQVVRLKENVGLGNALNIGLNHCKNELIARMDSDDIAVRDRCELQRQYMLNNQTVSIVSGRVLEFLDNTDSIVGERIVPLVHDEICKYSKKRNPFNHPAVMYRKQCVVSVGGYSEKFHLFEDYHLWIRLLLAGYRGANLNETLIYMRTPRDFYIRRGGYKYAKDMLRFHKWLMDVNWTNIIDFCTGAIPHAIVCILPDTARTIVYKKLHS